MKGWGIAVAVAACLAGAATPALAGPEDAITPIDQYTTAKAKSLASTYKKQLVQFYEHVYHCLPWLGVNKNGIGFRQPKGAQADDRYLTLWVTIDQADDPNFAKLPLERRVSAMFSRYGTDLLRRMASIQPIVADPNVHGFSVVLSWLKPGTGKAVQPVNETLALFADKPTTLGFLGKRVSAAEFTRRAKFSVFDGTSELGRLPLEVWEDSFVKTFKVANYEVPKGQRCSG